MVIFHSYVSLPEGKIHASKELCNTLLKRSHWPRSGFIGGSLKFFGLPQSVPQSCRNSKDAPFSPIAPHNGYMAQPQRALWIHWHQFHAEFSAVQQGRTDPWTWSRIFAKHVWVMQLFIYYIILYYMILYYIILYTCRYKQKYTYMIVYVWIILDYVVFTYDISLHLHSVLILRTMSLHVVKSRRISHLWNRPMDVHPLKHTSWWKNRPTTQRWLISGKLLHNYGKIHHVQWENRLFRLGHVQ